MVDSAVPPSKKSRCAAFVVVLLASLAFGSFAHAGWIENRDGKTIIHVKVERLPDVTLTDVVTLADVAGVREFTRRFPEIFAARYRDKYKANPDKYGRHNWDNVEIVLDAYSPLAIEGMGMETVMMSIAGGVSPDVLYVNFRKSDNYIREGFLYPLDKPEDNYLTGMTAEEQAFRIHPKIWPVIRRKGPAGKKHVWAIPYGGAMGRVLLYRKDLFKQAGVPYPTNEWTWDDLYDACKKITDPGRGIYGLMLHGGKHESWGWVTFLWSAGGEVMVYDEPTDQWEITFDSPAGAVALDFYTKLSTEPWIDSQGKERYGYAYKDVVDQTLKWQLGEIAMMFEYVDEKVFSSIDPDLTGMIPVPMGPTGDRGAELNSRMMGLFARIKSPAVRDAAWEYLKFYDCRDSSRIKTRIMVEGGLGHFVNPKYLRMFGYTDVIRLAPKTWPEIFKIAIETGKPEPYGKNSNFAYDMMTLPIAQADKMARAGQLPKDEKERLKVLEGLLHQAAGQAEEEMIGIVPPRERLYRRLAAVATLVAIVVVFTIMFRKIIRAFTPPLAPGEKKKGWQFRRYAWAYIIMLPAVLTVFVWQYIPLARGSVMAFQDYNVMGGSSWVWLDNFGDALWNRLWWESVWNSLRYSFLIIALTFLPPVILAVLLQEVPKGKILFRTLFYLPAVITGLVVILLWKTFYEPSEFGVLNRVLLHIPAIGFLAIGLVLFLICAAFSVRMFRNHMRVVPVLCLGVGVSLFYTCYSIAQPIFSQPGAGPWYAVLFQTLPQPYMWLKNPQTAMLCCVLPLVWAGMGPGCLIYLAALKGIAEDYYEAAEIDGAGFIDKILFIVFPMLRALLIINFIGVFIMSWKATGNILAMTGGGVATATEVAGLHIFFKAFLFLKFGPATAMSWILGLMLIGFTVNQLRILSRLEFRAAGSITK